MKKILLILFVFLQVPNCLKAKRSSFDFNGPSGFPFAFGLFLFVNRNQSFSVGGNITGFTAGKLTLQNKAGSDLILDPTANYAFTGIASGSTYSISIKTHPVGLACTLSNPTGTANGNITNVNIACVTSTATALYALGNTAQSFWMDYVKSDGNSPLDSTGTACTGTETGYYNACIHAGEFKKISVPNITSCTGITATDSLSAFNWKCILSSNNTVSVVSTGLRGDKGLTDLIDFTSPGSWRDIFVTVQLNGATHLTSATGKWWDNPIVVQNNGGVLTALNTIYIANTNVAATDYRMNSVDKVALVVKPGIIKSLSNAIGDLILMTNKFQWVEGSFYNNAMTTNIISLTSTAKFSVLRNLNLTGTTSFTTGINATSASNLSLFLHNIYLANLSVALNLNANGVILNKVNANNCINSIRVYQSDMVISNSLAFNSLLVAGFESTSSTYSNNLYLNNTSANQNANGFSLSTGSGTINKTTYHNILSVNNATGIRNADTFSTKFINLISADNNANQQYNETGGTVPGSNSIMNGILKLPPFATLGPTPGINAAGNRTNGSELTPATITVVTLPSSFVGKVTSTDTKNASNTNGISTGPPTDWFNFANNYRGFGNDGGAFPVSANRNNCSTNCRIWDWSLKATDTVARNVNHCPSGTIVDTHQWSATTQTSCNDFKGAVFNIGTNSCITTFLRNAVEIFGDGVGNENGICESGEECMYTPNIGAYQGHSSDSTNSSKLILASQSTATTTTCSDVTIGTVSNVKLWKFDTNGY
jgi:hypothetical protein